MPRYLLRQLGADLLELPLQLLDPSGRLTLAVRVRGWHRRGGSRRRIEEIFPPRPERVVAVLAADVQAEILGPNPEFAATMRTGHPEMIWVRHRPSPTTRMIGIARVDGPSQAGPLPPLHKDCTAQWMDCPEGNRDETPIGGTSPRGGARSFWPDGRRLIESEESSPRSAGAAGEARPDQIRPLARPYPLQTLPRSPPAMRGSSDVPVEHRGAS